MVACLLTLGSATDTLDTLQQGYSYPQGKPQLAPGSLLQRLQVYIEPETFINTPPMDVLPTTFDQSYPTDQFNIQTPQYNLPELLPHLETHVATTTTAMQPDGTSQYDYPDTYAVNQFEAVVDTNYNVAATVPQYANSYVGAAPAPPAAMFDEMNGYSYSVPSIPF